MSESESDSHSEPGSFLSLGLDLERAIFPPAMFLGRDGSRNLGKLLARFILLVGSGASEVVGCEDSPVSSSCSEGLLGTGSGSGSLGGTTGGGSILGSFLLKIGTDGVHFFFFFSGAGAGGSGWAGSSSVVSLGVAMGRGGGESGSSQSGSPRMEKSLALSILARLLLKLGVGLGGIGGSSSTWHNTLVKQN